MSETIDGCPIPAVSHQDFGSQTGTAGRLQTSLEGVMLEHAPEATPIVPQTRRPTTKLYVAPGHGLALVV